MTDLIKRSMNQILDDLPEICFLRDLSTNEPIAVRKGECGFWPMPGRDPEAYNKRQGITPAQVEAMRTGSIFGFNCPGADPLNNQDATDMA